MAELKPFDRNVEFLNRAEIESLQFSKLRHMLKHVASTNRFYARVWGEAGVNLEKIRSLEDFRSAIPMVEKSHFVEDQKSHPPFGTRLANSPDERIEIYTTSGTSGQGVEVHAQTKRELAAMEHLYGFYFCWAGLRPGDPVMLTVPITMMAGGRIEYQGALGYNLTVYPVGNYDAERKLELLKRFSPKALYGSSSYFAHLAALTNGQAPASSVDVLLTGMEGVGFSFLKRLEDLWGAKAADRFGCTQMRTDFMFTDETGVGEPDRPGVLYNMDPYVYLEVLDTATGLPVKDGEFGELVVTSLYHFDNPVIRNRLRDGAVFRQGGYPGSVRSFNGIEVASIGRTDDVKKVKGVNLYPQAVDDLIYSLPEIEQYEVVLSSTPEQADMATLNILLRHPIATSAAEVFRSRVSSLVRERMGISFDVQLVLEMAVSDYKARRWKDLRSR